MPLFEEQVADSNDFDGTDGAGEVIFDGLGPDENERACIYSIALQGLSSIDSIIFRLAPTLAQALPGSGFHFEELANVVDVTGTQLLGCDLKVPKDPATSLSWNLYVFTTGGDDVARDLIVDWNRVVSRKEF